jgi:hypothetical protein
MNIDSSPAQSSPSPSTTTINILMEEKNMKQREGERSKYTVLKDCTFTLTSVYDPRLMKESGMDTEFPLIFHGIGWNNFWTIEEPGCKLLIAEFLCTRQLFNTGVTFRMFTKEFSLIWKELS